ncbi:DUF1289 domain-containing protein [Psychrosphaera ytuae]|uniref:DUF1289 domain-containing protein n=1 Tax=Psychrosphaera ytuae TaxID=2820710 RepID=A0A975DAQ8_9GAMM|nr:DUF1289 domain-containing protein [Psychrosphaera ytuae]
MPQLEMFQIPSPCIGICQNGPNGYCYGCFRSRDERFYWTKLEDEQKRHVIKLCKMRKRRWLAKQEERRIEAQNLPADGHQVSKHSTQELFSSNTSDNSSIDQDGQSSFDMFGFDEPK